MKALEKLLEFLEKPKYFLLILMLIYTPVVYYGIKTEVYDSDEYIYYYMAYAISEGQRPYVDFFCAHMPLMLYPLAAIYKIFGPSFALGKIVPLISFFFVAFLTYLIGEHYRKYAGMIACALLMLSPTIHAYSHSFYGVFFCLAIGLASYYAYLKDKRFLSGFLIVLAMFSRLNIYPLFILIFLFNLKEKRFYYGMLAASPLLLFLLTPNFIEDTMLYHLERVKDSSEFRGYVINVFIAHDWPLLALTLTGALILCIGRKRKALKEEFEDLRRNDKSDVRIIVFAALYFILLITNRSLFNYYFIFDMPFMALISALGLLQYKELNTPKALMSLIPLALMLFAYDIKGMIPIGVLLLIARFIGKNKTLLLVLGVMLIIVFSNYYSIITAFWSHKIDAYDSISDYVSENTKKDDKILYLGFANVYVAMKSQRILAGNFIDITDQVFFRYGSRMDETFLKAMEEGAPLVVFDLYHTTYLFDKGVSFPSTMAYLRDNYVPMELFYEWDEETHRPFVIWLRKSRIAKGEEFTMPSGNTTVYLFQRYYYYLNGEGKIEEKTVSDLIDVSQPYVPKALRGRNIYNLTFIPENVLKWPLKQGEHYKLSAGDKTSDVYVASTEGDIIRVMVDTNFQGMSAAFSEIWYNYAENKTERILAFSRVSDKVVKGFIPSYQQIPLTKEEYMKLVEYAGNINEGSVNEVSLTGEEYERLRLQVQQLLWNSTSNQTLELKR